VRPRRLRGAISGAVSRGSGRLASNGAQESMAVGKPVRRTRKVPMSKPGRERMEGGRAHATLAKAGRSGGAWARGSRPRGGGGGGGGGPGAGQDRENSSISWSTLVLVILVCACRSSTGSQRSTSGS